MIERENPKQTNLSVTRNKVTNRLTLGLARLSALQTSLRQPPAPSGRQGLGGPQTRGMRTRSSAQSQGAAHHVTVGTTGGARQTSTVRPRSGLDLGRENAKPQQQKPGEQRGWLEREENLKRNTQKRILRQMENRTTGELL